MVRLSPSAPLRPGHDYVLIGRRAALRMPFERLVEDFGRALGRVHGRQWSGKDRPATPHAGTRVEPDMSDQKNTILAIVLSRSC